MPLTQLTPLTSVVPLTPLVLLTSVVPLTPLVLLTSVGAADAARAAYVSGVALKCAGC
ncbi:hypothetical protein [Nonomuraea sp. NPDC005650]|uniref:hypothetical protein n=1 Tax=Nonomuraea sp. NPDC005650 TaxID=3157045 RepID=UPI0033ACCEEA